MASNDTEPFPASSPHVHFTRKESARDLQANGGTRRRRKSSGLGADPRGDTGAIALATLADPPPPPSNGPLSRTPSEKARPHSKRRKAKSLFRRWVRISLRHTWLNPLIILIVIFALYAINPTTSNPLHCAIFLSYPLPRPADASPETPTQYGKGGQDFAFVAFYTVVLSFTREFLMQCMIRPLAIRLGIKSRAKQSRFMEQFYTAVYFSIFGPLGLYVMSRSPVWYFNTTAMFENFPHYTHEALFKAYYLLQAAYWTQQGLVLILMLEKPRKDFKELVAHHIVTIALIWCSYRFHFTYMGVAVYITHDISDFFLATSLCLHYTDSIILAPYMVMFIGIWAYLRHYINLSILWAVLTEFKTVGPFELNWETQQYKCWISQYICFSLLASLQALNIFWFFLILRIAYRFAVTATAADVREEEEEEEEPEDHEIEEAKAEEKQRLIESNGNGNTPKVLLNGAPVNESAIVDDMPVEAPRRRKG